MPDEGVQRRQQLADALAQRRNTRSSLEQNETIGLPPTPFDIVTRPFSFRDLDLLLLLVGGIHPSATGGFLPRHLLKDPNALQKVKGQIDVILDAAPQIRQEIDQMGSFIAQGPGGEAFKEHIMEQTLKNLLNVPSKARLIRPEMGELGLSRAPQSHLSGGLEPPPDAVRRALEFQRRRKKP